MIEDVYDANNLIDSFNLCCIDTAWKESVQRSYLNLMRVVYKARYTLRSGSYMQKPFFIFDILERGKARHIRSLHISDRMVQKSVYNFALLPLIVPYLIYDNGASIKNKGIDFSRKRLNEHLFNYYCNYGSEGYILLIDFKKYFDNIDHDILIEKLSNIIKDEEVLNLITYLIGTFAIDLNKLDDRQFSIYKDEIYYEIEHDSYLCKDTNEDILYKSLGMGSQLSQICGIYYPTDMDNFCKTVCGLKYYGRYMDDTYIIHHDKEYLKFILSQIIEICNTLKIKINPHKTQIQKLDHFTYLKIKYNLTKSGRIVRNVSRDTLVRERRKLHSLKKFMDNGNIDLQYIINQYKSWRYSILRFDSYRSIKRMDEVFESLYNTRDFMV